MKVLLALCFTLVHVWAEGEKGLMDHASFESTEDDDYDCDQEYFLGQHQIKSTDGFVLVSALCKHNVKKTEVYIDESKKTEEYSDQLSFEYRIYRKGFHLVTFRKKDEPLVNIDRMEPHIIKALQGFKAFKEDKEQEIVNSILIDDSNHPTFFVYFTKNLYMPKFVGGVESAFCFKISFFLVQKETNGGYREFHTAGLPAPADKEKACGQLQEKLQEARKTDSQKDTDDDHHMLDGHL